MSSSNDPPTPEAAQRGIGLRLTRAARRRLRRRGISWIDGDDVVQEAWVRLLSRGELGELDTPETRRKLLTVVARRVAIDASRRPNLGEESPSFTLLPDPESARATPLERTEQQRRLRSALARLGGRQRALVFLRLWLTAPWELCAHVLAYPTTHAAECAYLRTLRRLRRQWPSELRARSPDDARPY